MRGKSARTLDSKMKFKHRSTSRRIAFSAAEDAIGYVIGLSGFPIPIATLRELWRITRRNIPSNFVNWEFRNWPLFYEVELPRCLSINFKGKSYRIPHVKEIDNCDLALPQTNFIFRISKRCFSLNPAIRSLTEASFEKLLSFLKRNRRFANEVNLRPTSIDFVDGKCYIDCERVYYRDFVHTNLLLDAKDKTKSVTLREFVHKDGKVENISSSVLANHLGIEMLLFTSDGSMILQVRSRKVAFWSRQLSAAASGAISASDALERDSIPMNEFNKLREMFEEIGVGRDDIVPESVIFLGLTRDIIRGGKPELLLSATTRLSVKDIFSKREEARDKWESKKIETFHFGNLAFDNLQTSADFHKFHSKVDELIEKYGGYMSVDLLAAFSMWCKLRTSKNRI